MDWGLLQCRVGGGRVWCRRAVKHSFGQKQMRVPPQCDACWLLEYHFFLAWTVHASGKAKSSLVARAASMFPCRMFLAMPDAVHDTQPGCRAYAGAHFKKSAVWDMTRPKRALKTRALERASNPVTARVEVR